MRILAVIILSLLFSGSVQFKDIQRQRTHQEVLSDFIELRNGMFICYNIMSYGAEWGEANYPIDSFNPQKLDCEQWAHAAVSANMTFGLLTTKHHEGFCLWDSEFTEYDVASTPYKKDIVRQYVDAFRKYNLKIGLYYSIWDSTNEIDKDLITAEKMDFIKGQITELLTNYGKVDYFVMDGWFWRMGHDEVSYNEIRGLIRELQPDCLITDHTHLQSTFHVDIPYFEGPFGAFPSEENEMASALGHCSVKGNGWFWSEKTPNGMKANENASTIVDILTKCESRYCNFMLNCMPNRDGLMDPLYIDLLEEIGALWSPDKNRPPLPLQAEAVIYEVEPVGVSAPSGNAEYLFSPWKIPGKNYYDWISDGKIPQNITIDLGQVYSNINIINITPQHRCKPAPETSLIDGNITRCKIYSSTDSDNFKLLTEEKWVADGKMRSITFSPQKARFLKIEVVEHEGKNAVITQVQVGSSSEKPEVVL